MPRGAGGPYADRALPYGAAMWKISVGTGHLLCKRSEPLLEVPELVYAWPAEAMWDW